MLKLLFISLVLLHALLHVKGFKLSIYHDDGVKQDKSISTTLGAFWLLTSLLLVTSIVLFFIAREGWPVILLIAIALSQILIISQWRLARFGTIVNIILLCVAIPAFGNMRFQQRINEEVTLLRAKQDERNKTSTSFYSIAEMPLIIQRWLTRSGITRTGAHNFVQIKQQGNMRLKPGGKWMPFEAEEYFTISEPSFVWNSYVKMFPMFYLNGRDKFQNGEGEMLIKALSLFTVVDEKPGKRINESSLLRYLGETCWFPSAALSKNIKWETIDSVTAKATMNYNGTIASGTFQFNKEGDVTGFYADRYYKTGTGYTKEKWQVRINAYKDFNGDRLPSRCEIIWLLPEGDFKWMNIEIGSIKYNYTTTNLSDENK